MNYRQIVVDYLLMKQGKSCGICGRYFSPISPPEIDHIAPRSLGGTDELSNLQAVHHICNVRKGAVPTVDSIDKTTPSGVRALAEIKLIQEALIVSPTIKEAAIKLKISYRQLRYLIKKYNIFISHNSQYTPTKK